MRLVTVAVLGVLFLSPTVEGAPGAAPPAANDEDHLNRLTGALMEGIHLGQVLEQESRKIKGDAELFSPGKLTVEKGKELFAASEQLSSHPDEVIAWVRKQKMEKAAIDVGELVTALDGAPEPDWGKLPVGLLFRWLENRVGAKDRASAAAVANILQESLDIDKPGPQLRELIVLHYRLGLKVNFAQLGLPAQDSDFLAIGKELAPRTAACPYKTSPDFYQQALRVMENIANKATGYRDKTVLGKEILRDPAMERLIPALKAMPAKRLAFLGHSLMFTGHWSTAASWCDIAGEAAKQVNPGVEYRDYQSGSITAGRAVKEHLAAMLEFKPTDTFLLMVPARGVADQQALEKIITELRKVGSRVCIVDDVRPGTPAKTPDGKDVHAFEREACGKLGGTFLEFVKLSKDVPGSDKWIACDDIHMNTEGHVFYAKELLKFLASEEQGK